MRNHNLVNARKSAGFTQKEVANRIGVKEVSYQRYEYGERPSLLTAIRIADLFGILDIRYLWNERNLLKNIK